MARSKYLSLKEARKMKRLDRFSKEHPSEGDKKLAYIPLIYVVQWEQSAV